MDNLLSLEEARRFLGFADGEIDRLIQSGKLQAYKIGGTYLRFRKDDILTLKQELRSGKGKAFSLPWLVRVREFWRFNNFYIISLFLIAVLFFIVIRS